MEETKQENTIGDNIRNLRLKADLTQTELAGKIGFTRDGIAKLESNTSNMTIETLLNICKALKCSPNMVLKGQY